MLDATMRRFVRRYWPRLLVAGIGWIGFFYAAAVAGAMLAQ